VLILELGADLRLSPEARAQVVALAGHAHLGPRKEDALLRDFEAFSRSRDADLPGPTKRI
jgi:hypothetical protein